jgi:hypothetical protein
MKVKYRNFKGELFTCCIEWTYDILIARIMKRFTRGEKADDGLYSRQIRKNELD